MRHMLRAVLQLEHRQNLGAGIDGQPQNLLGAAQPGAQLVELQMREMQMAEDALVQGVHVPACSSEPSRHRGLSKAKDPLCGGKVEPFGQSREHHGDLLQGRFQAIQGSVASSAERGAARLTAKGLDRLGSAMRAIAKKPRGSEHRRWRSTRTADWDRQSPRCSPGWRAPRRLLTSRQRRTGAGAGTPADQAVEASRQAEQLSGQRCFSRRWSLLRLALPREEEGRRENQPRRQSLGSREEEADQEQE